MTAPANDPTTVLIVDDEPAVRDLMARWVTSLGFRPSTASHAQDALEKLRARHHDLAVIDIMMPGKNGLWLAGEVRRDHPNTAVVIATAYTGLLEQTPPTTPIADLLIKPFKRERFVLAVDRGREWCRQAQSELEWHAKLSAEVRERIEDICAAVARAHAAGEAEADALMAIAAARTPRVVEHAERVVRLAVAVAHHMALDPDGLPELQRAARFLDIGKAALPEALLTKPSPLTPGEVAITRRHVHAGAEILARTRTLYDIEPVVRASHEWFGGGGYPERLEGRNIPVASRIISVCAAYDAMTHERAYRARFDSAEAVAELLRCAPGQFDPEVVIAFLNVLGRD